MTYCQGVTLLLIAKQQRHVLHDASLHVKSLCLVLENTFCYIAPTLTIHILTFWYKIVKD